MNPFDLTELVVQLAGPPANFQVVQPLNLKTGTTFKAESLLDLCKQLVANAAVTRQHLIAIALADHHRGVERRPVLNINRHRARELKRLVMGFR